MTHDPERHPLRKHRLSPAEAPPTAPSGALDLTQVATLAYSSEDPAHPVEHLLDPYRGAGGTRWVSARPDMVEHLVVEFDVPQSLTRVIYEAEETERERTQQVRIEASMDGAQTYQPVLIQEYTFSPQGATFQREDLRVELAAVTHLRLTIVPHQHGSGAASLTSLQLFS